MSDLRSPAPGLRPPASGLRSPLRIWLGIATMAKSAGGPAVVVQHLSEHLAALGAEVTLLTGLLPDGEPEFTPGSERVRVIRLPHREKLFEFRKCAGGVRDTICQAQKRGEMDVFHDFGLWLPSNHSAASAAAAVGLPYISSPCGMLSPWAMRHKAWKKQIAWRLYQYRDLLHARVLVATSRQEMAHFARWFPDKPVALIPNGVNLPEAGVSEAGVSEAGGSEAGGHRADALRIGPPPTADRQLSPVQRSMFDVGRSMFSLSSSDHGQQTTLPFSSTDHGQQTTDNSSIPPLPRTLLFLGRVHPVKGLMNLVEAWAQVRPPGWRCIIAGPDEAGHRLQLEEALIRHRISDDFTFPGMVDGQDKWRLLAEADLFVLPSFTENFGIAAAEALAAGLPVITTKGTPWEELISHGCGWWVDIGVAPLTAALRDAVALNDVQRSQMGERGRRLVEENYSWPKIGQHMMEIYKWVIGSDDRPGCVHPQW